MDLPWQRNQLSEEELIAWFDQQGHWLIRKVPGTKDQMQVVGSVVPPDHVKQVYGIE